MQKAQKKKRKTPKHSPPTRSSGAIRVSAKDGLSYAKILKVIKASVNPSDAGLEVLTARRTRKDEILLMQKNRVDVLASEKALDRVVGEKAEVGSLVSERSLKIREPDKTVTREEVVAALCIALGKPYFGDPCRL